MRSVAIPLASLALSLIAAGCDSIATRSDEYVLPEGDAESGQKTFVSLGCTACHTVRDLELPPPQIKGPVTVMLGGGVSKVKTHAELVTAIVNPSHRLAKGYSKERVTVEGESVMSVYNDVMTVTELLDLVAFLQSRYELRERPGYKYRVYDYGEQN